jgi:SSS family solute:Na+ symporter
MTTLIRSSQDKDFPWTGVLLGSAIIGFWYWCTDQFIVQRVLSGRDQQQARRGTIFGAYLKTTPVFIFLIPGMIAYALSQKISAETGLPLLVLHDSDAAFSTLVKELLPAGVKGIVVGGILAALMSSLASLFNSSAMLFTVDFYKKYKPNATEKHYVTVGRIATVVIVVLGVLWIPVMKGMGKVLYNYLQDVQSLLAPGIASVFLLGVFWKRTTAQGGLWGLIIGFVLGMFRLFTKVIATSVMIPEEVKAVDGNSQWIAEQAANPDGLSSFQHLVVRFLDVNWLHYEIFLFAFCLVSIFIISMFTKKPRPEQLEGLTFGSGTPEQKAETRASWNMWDVVHTLIICGIVIAFYIYFW